MVKGKAKAGTKLKIAEALDEPAKEPARETVADGITRTSEESKDSNPGADPNDESKPIKGRELSKEKEMDEDEEEQL